jgi:hypothetical protein
MKFRKAQITVKITKYHKFFSMLDTPKECKHQTLLDNDKISEAEVSVSR